MALPSWSSHLLRRHHWLTLPLHSRLLAASFRPAVAGDPRVQAAGFRWCCPTRLAPRLAGLLSWGCPKNTPPSTLSLHVHSRLRLVVPTRPGVAAAHPGSLTPSQSLLPEGFRIWSVACLPGCAAVHPVQPPPDPAVRPEGRSIRVLQRALGLPPRRRAAASHPKVPACFVQLASFPEGRAARWLPLAPCALPDSSELAKAYSCASREITCPKAR